MRDVKIISQIIGILINNSLSAKEAIEILEESKETYLERSFHVSYKNKAAEISTAKIEIDGNPISFHSENHD